MKYRTKTAVVILSYNSRDITAQCIDGLLMNEAAELFVIDNGSTDGTVDMIRSRYPAIHIINLPCNLGFGGGNNIGMREAFNNGHDVVFLLNNDTIIDEPFIEPCLKAINDDTRIGIVGPVVVDADAPDRIQAAGGRINKYNLTFPYRHRGAVYKQACRLENVDYVLGAAMAITASAYNVTGGFDTDYYPAYVEEADICYRTFRAGMRVCVTYESRVRHIGGFSAGVPGRAYSRLVCNRLRFGINHLRKRQFAYAVLFFAGHLFWNSLIGKPRLHRKEV
ncbi:MAG: glycosyltransferase family 2 protein [Chloroflexota bacterium]